MVLTDHDGPDVDKDEEADGCVLPEWEDQREQMVWQALGPSVNWVESMAGKWSWHDPLVMRLVQVSVNRWVMETAVDQVDEAISEDEEERKLEVKVELTVVVGIIVELGEATDFNQEEWSGESRHSGKRPQGDSDFLAHLILEELGMLEGILVEDKDVGERGSEEI